MTHSKIAVRTLMIALLAGTLFTTSCKDDDATVQENITRVQVHLIGGGLNREFKWEDADGDGGNAPTIEEIVLAPNTTYSAYIHLYDGNKELNDEIEAESNSHLFTFTVTGANLTFTGLNQDAQGKPFGIASTWTSGAASTGAVTLRLYHEPTDKSNPAAPGGEVDMEVTLPVKVQ